MSILAMPTRSEASDFNTVIVHWVCESCTYTYSAKLPLLKTNQSLLR